MSKTTIRLEPKSLDRGREGRKRAFVVVLSGDRMGEMFPLKEGAKTTIGRGLQTDVRINDEGISRTHALVEEDGGVYYLCDAGSTNGTFANGTRVDRQPLTEGDKIQIGASSVLKFTFNDDLDEDFQRNLYESALRDRLTGVFNRGYFNNRLESDVARAARKPLSLVLFDIDGFRQINDASTWSPRRRRDPARAGRSGGGHHPQRGHLRAIRRRGVRAHLPRRRRAAGLAGGLSHPRRHRRQALRARHPLAGGHGLARRRRSQHAARPTAEALIAGR
ncbi:MAG: FHA domain-containing protein [Nannocystaceae bacterium]